MRRRLELIIGAVLGPIAIWVIASAFVILSSPQVAHAAECSVSGLASWYGYESGSVTASGQRFDPMALTAAMPSRSHLGERWRVTYRGRSVVVTVNDVGPAARLHRVIDLSRAAAERIGLLPAGVGRVCLERLGA